MKISLLTMQYAVFQGIVGRICRELYHMDYNSNVDVHGLNIKEIHPASANRYGKAALDAALCVADHIHIDIHLDIKTTLNNVADIYYTGLGITRNGAASGGKDTTNNTDAHNHYTFNTPYTFDSIGAVVTEHVVNTITAQDTI